jgi:hypothetical protein
MKHFAWKVMPGGVLANSLEARTILELLASECLSCYHWADLVCEVPGGVIYMASDFSLIEGSIQGCHEPYHHSPALTAR